MATIQIRDVPEDVHETFRARAHARGMSLQQYLRQELIDVARTRPAGEVVKEIRQDLAADAAGFSTESAVDLVRAHREGRSAEEVRVEREHRERR